MFENLANAIHRWQNPDLYYWNPEESRFTNWKERKALKDSDEKLIRLFNLS